MAEIVVEIPDGLKSVLGGEFERPETRVLFREAVEEKIRVLLLFKVVDSILKESKLTDEQAGELTEELREGVARRHGLI